MPFREALCAVYGYFLAAQLFGKQQAQNAFNYTFGPFGPIISASPSASAASSSASVSNTSSPYGIGITIFGSNHTTSAIANFADHVTKNLAPTLTPLTSTSAVPAYRHYPTASQSHLSKCKALHGSCEIVVVEDHGTTFGYGSAGYYDKTTVMVGFTLATFLLLLVLLARSQVDNKDREQAYAALLAAQKALATKKREQKLRADLASLNSAYTALENLNNLVTLKKNAFQHRSIKQARTISTRNMQITGLERAQQHLSARLATEEAEVTTARQRIADLEAIEESQKKQLEDNHEKMMRNDQAFFHLRGNFEGLKKEHTELQSSTTRNELTKVQSSLEQYKGLLESRDKEIKGLTEAQSKDKKTISELEARNVSLEKTSKNLLGKYDDLEEKLKAANESLDLYAKDVKEDEATIKDLREQVADLSNTPSGTRDTSQETKSWYQQQLAEKDVAHEKACKKAKQDGRNEAEDEVCDGMEDGTIDQQAKAQVQSLNQQQSRLQDRISKLEEARESCTCGSSGSDTVGDEDSEDDEDEDDDEDKDSGDDEDDEDDDEDDDHGEDSNIHSDERTGSNEPESSNDKHGSSSNTDNGNSSSTGPGTPEFSFTMPSNSSAVAATTPLDESRTAISPLANETRNTNFAEHDHDEGSWARREDQISREVEAQEGQNTHDGYDADSATDVEIDDGYAKPGRLNIFSVTEVRVSLPKTPQEEKGNEQDNHDESSTVDVEDDDGYAKPGRQNISSATKIRVCLPQTTQTELKKPVKKEIDDDDDENDHTVGTAYDVYIRSRKTISRNVNRRFARECRRVAQVAETFDLPVRPPYYQEHDMDWTMSHPHFESTVEVPRVILPAMPGVASQAAPARGLAASIWAD